MNKFYYAFRAKCALLLVLAVTFSCDDHLATLPKPVYPTPAPPVTATPGTTDLNTFRSLATQRVSNVFLTANNYDGKVTGSDTENYFYYNYERLIREELTTQNTQYQIPNVDLDSFSHEVSLNIVSMNSYTSTAAFDIATVTGVTSHFNASQITVLNWYINKVINTGGSLAAIDYYRTAKVKVGTVTPALTNDQKIEVLAILEFCNEYAKSFFAGNATTMYNDIASKAKGAANGRVAGCSISFKGVMLSAVVSGAAGAVRGAVIGAAGGTVALPLFGTATGAVGGAVFGFAGAFIGGAGLALVEQGLANCLFSRNVTAPPVECNQLSYAKAHMSLCLKEGNDLKLWYHL